MRSSEMFLELWLLRYRAKGRNEQNVYQIYNINYFDIFVFVVRYNILKILLARVIIKD
jgi:hypothetical protein